MFHGGATYSTERLKCYAKEINIPRIGSHDPRRCKMFHIEGQMFHRGAKYSTDNVKYSTEVVNIPRTM